MAKVHPLMADAPEKIRFLPINEKGFYVPWFSHWEGDKPIVQIADMRKMRLAIRKKLCWICGHPLGSYGAFVVGSMCVVSRVCSEPPNHRDCALFAVRACPYITKPLSKRTGHKTGLPLKDEPEFAFTGNPKLWLVYSTRSWSPHTSGESTFFRFGEPDWYEFFHEGRKATREEIDEGFAEAQPRLQQEAEQKGPQAIRYLLDRTAQFNAMRDWKLEHGRANDEEDSKLEMLHGL